MDSGPTIGSIDLFGGSYTKKRAKTTPSNLWKPFVIFKLLNVFGLRASDAVTFVRQSGSVCCDIGGLDSSSDSGRHILTWLGPERGD